MLSEMGSAELSGWLAYVALDDEVRAARMARAFSLAMGGQSGQGQGQATDTFEGEEVIDTTDPAFAETFKGLIGK